MEKRRDCIMKRETAEKILKTGADVIVVVTVTLVEIAKEIWKRRPKKS